MLASESIDITDPLYVWIAQVRHSHWAADMEYSVECAWELQATLGEGPIWSADAGCVWFVDIKKRQLHRFNPLTKDARSWSTPDQAGFVAPLDDGFIVGLKSGLHRFDPQSGEFSLLTAVEPERPANRLNDGYVDSHGRLWFGSMDDGERELSGALYRFDASGQVHCMDTGYCITNGPAVSPDGRTLYHTSTMARTMYAFDLAADGSLHDKREFIRFTSADGYPDGTIIDSEGCLWTGLWGGWGLARFSPRGERLATLRLPCANVTKAAFGGADLRTLYITTARKGLDAAALAQQPLAGGLFAVHVPVPGLPQHPMRL